MKKNYFAFIIILLSVISCQKITDEKLVSGISADSYYTTPDGFKGLVNACYPYLREWYGQEPGFAMTEFGVDMYTEGNDGSLKYFNQYNSELNPSSTVLSGLWTSFYKGINTCNAVIDRAETIEGLNENDKLVATAEARYLRALYYFILVQTFGDIPMRTEELKTVVTESTRESQDRIYNEVIVPDLDYAIANLPPTQSEYGRATKPAAQALLSRVYLVLKNWEKVEALSRSLLTDYSFHLLPSYAAVFDGENQRNSEVIWSIQYTTTPLLNGPRGNEAHLFFLMEYDKEPGMVRDMANGRPFKRHKLTPFGNALFNNEADLRYVEGFQRVYYANNPANLPAGMKLGDTAVYITNKVVPDEVKASKIYKIYDLPVINTSGTRFLTSIKFLDKNRLEVNSRDGTKDFIVYRIAEVYLNMAEALFHQDRVEEAAEYLNDLRTERSVKGREAEMQVSPADVTEDYILDERGRELYGEMLRWFDLKRTGTLIDRVKRYNKEASPNIQEYHLLRPIPQIEIDRASNIVDQNLGYH